MSEEMLVCSLQLHTFQQSSEICLYAKSESYHLVNNYIYVQLFLSTYYFGSNYSVISNTIIFC